MNLFTRPTIITALSIALLGCLDAQAQTDEVASGQPVTQEKVLSNMFKASVGPGLIYSDFYAPSRIYKRHSCMDFDFTYNHVWNSGWGFGVNYAFSVANFNHEHLITQNYIGPSAVFAFRRGKFGFDVSMGLGFAQYAERVKGRDHQNRIRTFKWTEYGLGLYGQIGVEYLVSKHFGIGAQITSLAALFPRPDNDLVSDDENYGIQRVNILVGPRVYF